MADDTPQSPTNNQVVPCSIKREPMDEYRDYGSESNDFENISFLGEECSRLDLDVTLIQTPPENAISISTSPILQTREVTPAPLFVPTALAVRPGTPSRTKVLGNTPVMASGERRKALSKIPSRRGYSLEKNIWGPYSFNKQDKVRSLLRRLWASGFCKFVISKLKSFVAYFGPGFTLTVAIYLAISFGRDDASDSIANDLQYHHHLKSEEQVVLDEMYCATTQRTDFCAKTPGQIINLTEQCHLKDQEYQEKIQVLEGEITSLRQQYSENLALKMSKLKRLVRSVTNFRMERFCILKTSVYQYLLAFVTSAVSSICLCVRFYKRRLNINLSTH